MLSAVRAFLFVNTLSAYSKTDVADYGKKAKPAIERSIMANKLKKNTSKKGVKKIVKKAVKAKKKK